MPSSTRKVLIADPDLASVRALTRALRQKGCQVYSARDGARALELAVAGEPEEIFPFLGCSCLEEPLERYPVDIAFHGHAHRGSLEGKTRTGTPVYNVALPLLRRRTGGDLRIVELDTHVVGAA